MTVFTVITDNYDSLNSFDRLKNWKYICFTNTNIKANGWNLIKINDKGKKGSRKPKILWFDYVNDDITLYMDANWLIVGDLNDFLNKTYKPGSHTAFRHEKRGCVYDEISRCIELQNDNVNTIIEYKKELIKRGIEPNQGLMANNFIIRDNSTPKTPYKKWYADVEKYSHRDQLSFIPNSNGLDLNYINPELKYNYFKRKIHGT